MAGPANGKHSAVLWLAQVAAIAAVYYGAGRIGLSLALPPGHATAVWPPSGIALAAVLLLGFRVWPGIWLGAFLANIQDLVGDASDPQLVESFAVAATIGAGSTLQAVAAGGLVKRFTDYRHLFDHTGDVFRFAGVAAAAYPLGAIVGVTSLCAAGFVTWSAYTENFRTWWLGDLAGALVVAPLILVWSKRVTWTRREATEFALLLALAAAASAAAFWGVLPDSDQGYPVAFMLVPFVVWAAFRLGQHAVVLSTVVISAIATVGAAEGVGPFADIPQNAALLTLQAFVGVVAMTGLALAAAVAERERASDRFRVLVEAAPNAIIMADQNGRITELNAEAEKLFGYSRHELLGEQVERLIPPRLAEGHPDYRHGFLRSPQTRAMGAGRDLFGLRSDGSEVPVEIGLGPITTSEGAFTIALIVDITERKRIEEEARIYAEELARSNADLEQFAYVASHDLQEPLRMVTTYCELLQQRYSGRLDEDADDFIGFAVEGAARMRALVKDLLAYARVSSVDRRQAPVDCNEAVSHAIVNLQSAIVEEEARVSFEDLPTVVANATQIEQLFQNLIGNAIKFRGQDPPAIRLDAARRNGSWLFSVADNGIGMDPSHADRVFDVFHRLHPRRDYQGTGVGLAICKKIVERHGGRIWFESQPGEGSTFYFTLPAKAAE
jgi:PAS domain S-box-containing protein